MSTAVHTPGLLGVFNREHKRALAEEAAMAAAVKNLREAAPAMLAALKMLREIDDAYGFDLNEQQRDQMHDAIANAEGRS